MTCILTGKLPTNHNTEWRKFVLLMQTLGKEPTQEKFEVFKNRQKPKE